jgi:meromycolic acid 3-oxoacyl-[acyl-carrier protein] synthase II
MVRLATGNGLPDVVVTGVAMTTTLATDVDGTWKKLLDGQSGIRKLDDPFVEQFDLPVRIGGHLLEDFDSQLTRVELRRFSFTEDGDNCCQARLGGRRLARGGHQPADGFYRHWDGFN